jgi:hypothetical protein
MEPLHFPDITVVRSSILDDTFNDAVFANFEENQARSQVSQGKNPYERLGFKEKCIFKEYGLA